MEKTVKEAKAGVKPVKPRPVFRTINVSPKTKEEFDKVLKAWRGELKVKRLSADYLLNALLKAEKEKFKVGEETVIVKCEGD